MIDNVTVPMGVVGGNKVEISNMKADVIVTDSKGKKLKMKPDEFMKQLDKNTDKILNGEDFEFKSSKKDNKALKIGTAAVGTTAIVAGVIYRKDIKKFITNFSFKKLGNSVKDFFLNTGKKIKKMFKKEKPHTRTLFDNEAASKISKETNALKETAIAEKTNKELAAFDRMINNTKGAIHKVKQKMYERVFAK